MLKPPNVGSDEKKIKISLQWKGARSPVIMTHGVDFRGVPPQNDPVFECF